MTDLKHEVNAEQWAALIKERMDSGMTIKDGARKETFGSCSITIG